MSGRKTFLRIYIYDRVNAIRMKPEKLEGFGTYSEKSLKMRVVEDKTSQESGGCRGPATGFQIRDGPLLPGGGGNHRDNMEYRTV